jgi:hypothetical protein
MIKTIKNIQALSAFKQNRLNQKLSKLSVALAGAEFVQSSGVPYFGSLPLLSWIILCNPNLFKYFLAFSIFLITFYCADQLTQDETTTLETLLNYDQAVDLNTKAQIIIRKRQAQGSVSVFKCRFAL